MNIFSIHGRASLSEFWKVAVIGIVTMVISGRLDALIGAKLGFDFNLWFLVPTVLIAPTLIRRLHDVNMNGAYLGVPLFFCYVIMIMSGLSNRALSDPFFSFPLVIIGIYFGTFLARKLRKPGDIGANTYGDSQGSLPSNEAKSVNVSYSTMYVIMMWVMYIPVAIFVAFIAMLFAAAYGTSKSHLIPTVVLIFSIVGPFIGMVLYTVSMLKHIKNEKNELVQNDQNNNKINSVS